MPFLAIALIIAAALGGGTAIAAQNALPGDPLWGFKVHINEGIEGALSASNSAKAHWDLEALDARLAEAQTLEQTGKLTAEAQTDIVANFEDHTKGITDAIAKLQASGDTSTAADLATRFQATMARRAALFSDTAANNAAVQGKVVLSPLLKTVQATLEQATTLSAQVHADAEVKSSAAAH